MPDGKAKINANILILNKLLLFITTVTRASENAHSPSAGGMRQAPRGLANTARVAGLRLPPGLLFRARSRDFAGENPVTSRVAEGATNPETLRQTDGEIRSALESDRTWSTEGVRQLFCPISLVSGQWGDRQWPVTPFILI